MLLHSRSVRVKSILDIPKYIYPHNTKYVYCLVQIIYIYNKPYFQNPKSTKIKLITASVHEKTTKYSTKCTLDAESNKNIKDIEILLKRNWNFPKHIFNKNIERNI